MLWPLIKQAFPVGVNLSFVKLMPGNFILSILEPRRQVWAKLTPEALFLEFWNNGYRYPRRLVFLIWGPWPQMWTEQSTALIWWIWSPGPVIYLVHHFETWAAWKARILSICMLCVACCRQLIKNKERNVQQHVNSAHNVPGHLKCDFSNGGNPVLCTPHPHGGSKNTIS